MKTQKPGFTLIEFVVCILVVVELTSLGSYFKSHYRHAAEMTSFLNHAAPIRTQINKHSQEKTILDSAICTKLLNQHGAKLASPKYPTISIECSNRSLLIQKSSNAAHYDSVLEMAGYFQPNNAIQWICHSARTTSHTTFGQCQDWSHLSEWVSKDTIANTVKCNCFDSRTYSFDE